jgi:hypothetical protein
MMSLELKGGIDRLSLLIIDADKPWEDGGVAMGISNVKEVALGMARGDIIFRGAAGIETLTPGNIGEQLETQGAGHDPRWHLP